MTRKLFSVRILLCFFAIFCFLLLLPFFALAKSHTHSFAPHYTVRATCTDEGYRVSRCDCGETTRENTSPALGHDFIDKAVYYKKATCLETGEKGRYCKRCFAKTDVIYITKTGHTITTTVNRASFNNDGSVVKTCSHCSKTFGKETIAGISSVKLKKSTYTYDATKKTPEVVIKDSLGETLIEERDYTLKYTKGRKKPGIYNAKIIFKGDYEGEKTLSFKIKPKQIKALKAIPSFTSVKLSWDKSKGAEYYEIYLKSKKLTLIKTTKNIYTTINRIKGKALKKGKTYTFVIKACSKNEGKAVCSAGKRIKITTRPDKAEVISVKNGKATFKKQSCDGFEILVSTNKSFSNTNQISLNGKNSCALKGLVKGKKYYIKARAFVINDKIKSYGYYSEIKGFTA